MLLESVLIIEEVERASCLLLKEIVGMNTCLNFFNSSRCMPTMCKELWYLKLMYFFLKFAVLNNLVLP